MTTSSGISGSWLSRLIVGGAVRWWSGEDREQRLERPGAAEQVTGHGLRRRDGDVVGWSPKTRWIALYSAMSPTGVDVACALMWMTSPSDSAGSLHARRRMARGRAGPSGSGAVMWWASADRPTPASSRVDLRATSLGVLLGLEDEDARRPRRGRSRRGRCRRGGTPSRARRCGSTAPAWRRSRRSAARGSPPPCRRRRRRRRGRCGSCRRVGHALGARRRRR